MPTQTPVAPAMFLLLMSFAFADCPEPTTPNDLSRRVAAAEAGYRALDEGSFRAAAVAAKATLPCMGEMLLPPAAAEVHRLQALDAFFSGDRATAVLNFLSVRLIHPGYELPLDIAPMGHPLRQAFDESLEYDASGSLWLAPPAEGWILIDGQRVERAPTARPFVFQRFDGQSQVVETTYVAPGFPVPEYPRAVGVTEPITMSPMSPMTTPITEWRGPRLETLDLEGRTVDLVLEDGTVITGRLSQMDAKTVVVRNDTGNVEVLRSSLDRVRAAPRKRTGRLITGITMTSVGAAMALTTAYYAFLPSDIDTDLAALGFGALAIGHLTPGIIMMATSRPRAKTAVDIQVSMTPYIGPQNNGLLIAGRF